jgi:hypothetical protein
MTKKIRRFGLGAIIAIYDKKLLLRGAKVPALITTIVIALYSIYGSISKESIRIIIDIILLAIPTLLGFVLSGYALLIGFGNIEIIAKKKTTKDNKSIRPTLYQKVSTVFAVGLIMQITLLVTAFTLKTILFLELPCYWSNMLICNIINYFVFGIMLFGILYVTVMIKDLVINIFNFSQIHHFTINKNTKPEDN